MSFRTIQLTIEYCGTHYAGWQIQPHKKTIQGAIQDSLRRVAQENVHLIGASRTDAGVHALGQIAHFQTTSGVSTEKLFIALAGLLPEDISVTKVEEKGADFHARKSAKRKTYRYVVWNGRARKALLAGRAWHVWDRLDVASMRRAATCLMGRHDFSAFRAHQSDTKTSVREIKRIHIRKIPPDPPLKKGGGGDFLHIEITGNGFLKYMVRNIVGTLVDVGKGKLTASDVKAILKGRDRKKAGATAPACGLYLVSVKY